MLRRPPIPTLFPYTTLFRSGLAHPFQLVSLRDDDDGEVLAALVPVAKLFAGVLDRHRLLRNQDHVGAAGDSCDDGDPADRKSTRLNSSHVEISYAVFCLKKK